MGGGKIRKPLGKKHGNTIVCFENLSRNHPKFFGIALVSAFHRPIYLEIRNGSTGFPSNLVSPVVDTAIGRKGLATGGEDIRGNPSPVRRRKRPIKKFCWQINFRSNNNGKENVVFNIFCVYHY
jgi:hypothetical protein